MKSAKAKNKTSDLGSISDAIAKTFDQRSRNRDILNRMLKEPDHFIPDEYNPKAGVGLWKCEGGVCSYRKFPNGLYDPFSRHEYTEEFILLLAKINKLKARTPSQTRS